MADERGSHRSNGQGRSHGSNASRGNSNGRGYKPRGKSFGSNRSSGGFHKGNRNGSFRRDNGHGQDRDFRRDGEGGQERRSFHRNDRFEHGERRDFHRDDRRDFHRDDHRNDRGKRREFTAEEKQQYREKKRRDYMSKSRRNSDGTVSFPSQNPYTARRSNEPKMPAGIEWRMLSKEERERLRGLSKEHAENIGLHILAAFSLEEIDPDRALAHAKWVAHQASRIDFARETLALIAYRRGDYKLALREFKTAQRMNGYLDYLPFIADCERGLGNPKKAVEIAQSDEAKQLTGEAKAEMFLVYAGALADLNMWNQAIEIAKTLSHAKGLPGEYRMRAAQAEQYFLEESGRSDEAVALDEFIDSLEDRYADVEEDENDDSYVVDYDVADLPEDLMAKLGVTPDDAQYAPLDGEDGVNMDDETRLEEQEELSGAEMTIEPAQQQEINERHDENGTMGDPDLDDLGRATAEPGDFEEQVKEELE